MTTLTKNEVLLEGLPLDVPEWSHENHGTHFYRFLLQVPRLSGTPDILPVLLPESLCSHVCPDAPLRIQGQLRSYIGAYINNIFFLPFLSKKFLPFSKIFQKQKSNF